LAQLKTITGVCIPWKEVLAFLDTLPPWQELCGQVESRCSVLTDHTRRLMAAAVGTCSHHYSFPENLHQLFAAMNAGDARPFRWHGQVGPKRWLSVNTAIVAIRGWLADKSAVSISRQWGIRQKDIQVYLDLIGKEPSHIKRAMLKRLLWNIIDNAVHDTGLGIVGDCKQVRERDNTFADFTEAYRWDEKSYYFELRPENLPLRALDEEIAGFGVSGQAFLNYVRTPTQPFCQQKLMRYRQLALFRISNRWTDPSARPPAGIPQSDFEALAPTYERAVSRWYEGQKIPAHAAHRDVYERVFGLLGEITECKRAVVDCLVWRSKPATDLQEAAYAWLREHTKKAVR
jgi:hypothetical protein